MAIEKASGRLMVGHQSGVRGHLVTGFSCYGDIRLPDLREEIAQCERRGLMHDACVGSLRI